jgi:hypothetical protein
MGSTRVAAALRAGADIIVSLFMDPETEFCYRKSLALMTPKKATPAPL